MNWIKKLDNMISQISINFVRILFCGIIIGMLFVNSVYLYIDMPVFTSNCIWNYLGMIGNIGIIVMIVFLNRFPSKCLNMILLIGYVIAEIVFLKLVPIKPFSDMMHVTEIALSNFERGIEYLQKCTNNLPIVFIFNLIFRITTYDVFVLKVFNVICHLVILYFSCKTYENIYGKKNNLVYLCGLSCFSNFFYTNHIYNDILFTMFVIMILYFVTKLSSYKFDKIIIPILLFFQFLIRPVGIIVIIAIGMYYILKEQNIEMVINIFIIFVIFIGLYSILKNQIIPKSKAKEEYPIWSYIQMGMNETEFGFQDGSHSTKWTGGDVKNRILELGPKRLLKLFAKKEFWLWTEGTYQVERYAFGIGDNEQFFYDTPITKKLADVEKSNLRKTLDYFMKGQYFVTIALALIDMVIKDEWEETKKKKDVLLYIIIGLFCFYLIWEIKSRYIYCLYPIFLILASSGINKMINRINFRKDKENGKI